MRHRETLLITQTQEDLERAKPCYGAGAFVDVTSLLEWDLSKPTTRYAVGCKLARLMPTTTHQHVALVVPVNDGETYTQWQLRAYCHPIISIMTPGYKNVFAVDAERIDAINELRIALKQSKL